MRSTILRSELGLLADTSMSLALWVTRTGPLSSVNQETACDTIRPWPGTPVKPLPTHSGATTYYGTTVGELSMTTSVKPARRGHV